MNAGQYPFVIAACESSAALLSVVWRTVKYMVQSFAQSVTAKTNAGHCPFVMAAYASSAASLSVVYELVRLNPYLVASN